MLVAGYSLVACPCTLLLFGLSQRGQEYCCKVRFFDQMPTMFVGWNVEQGKRFAFFRQIKKANQLNAVCRGCIALVRFGLSFALCNGHVFFAFSKD